jgi:ribose transport system substrate-binding protein
MLDNLHHENLATLDSDWTRDSFAPLPAFVDTGSALVDKSNLDGFVAASKSLTGQ